MPTIQSVRHYWKGRNWTLRRKVRYLQFENEALLFFLRKAKIKLPEYFSFDYCLHKEYTPWMRKEFTRRTPVLLDIMRIQNEGNFPRDPKGTELIVSLEGLEGAQISYQQDNR